MGVGVVGGCGCVGENGGVQPSRISALCSWWRVSWRGRGKGGVHVGVPLLFVQHALHCTTASAISIVTTDENILYGTIYV